jgi:hypothetical protein
MEWGRDEWIVVNVECPVGRVNLLSYKDVSVDHRIGLGVVTQRLYLEPVVAVQGLEIAALVDFIRIDVEPTVSVDVTEAKVIASHCRVTTPVERGNVAATKSSLDKCAGLVVIDQDALESACREWFPAVKALADIVG